MSNTVEFLRLVHTSPELMQRFVVGTAFDEPGGAVRAFVRLGALNLALTYATHARNAEGRSGAKRRRVADTEWIERGTRTLYALYVAYQTQAPARRWPYKNALNLRDASVFRYAPEEHAGERVISAAVAHATLAVLLEHETTHKRRVRVWGYNSFALNTRLATFDPTAHDITHLESGNGLEVIFMRHGQRLVYTCIVVRFRRLQLLELTGPDDSAGPIAVYSDTSVQLAQHKRVNVYFHHEARNFLDVGHIDQRRDVEQETLANVAALLQWSGGVQIITTAGNEYNSDQLDAYTSAAPPKLRKNGVMLWRHGDALIVATADARKRKNIAPSVLDLASVVDFAHARDATLLFVYTNDGRVRCFDNAALVDEYSDVEWFVHDTEVAVFATSADSRIHHIVLSTDSRDAYRMLVYHERVVPSMHTLDGVFVHVNYYGTARVQRDVYHAVFTRAKDYATIDAAGQLTLTSGDPEERPIVMKGVYCGVFGGEGRFYGIMNDGRAVTIRVDRAFSRTAIDTISNADCMLSAHHGYSSDIFLRIDGRLYNSYYAPRSYPIARQKMVHQFSTFRSLNLSIAIDGTGVVSFLRHEGDLTPHVFSHPELTEITNVRARQVQYNWHEGDCIGILSTVGFFSLVRFSRETRVLERTSPSRDGGLVYIDTPTGFPHTVAHIWPAMEYNVHATFQIQIPARF